MIQWSASIIIEKAPEAVFEFLANIQKVPQAEDSPILALELITDGPPRLGSKYREVVQMMPLVRGEILSEITAFKPPWVLELTWTGPGMSGVDRYDLKEHPEGTSVNHEKHTYSHGVVRIMEPLMRSALIPRLEQRLVSIKQLLETRDEP